MVLNSKVVLGRRVSVLLLPYLLLLLLLRLLLIVELRGVKYWWMGPWNLPGEQVAEAEEEEVQWSHAELDTNQSGLGWTLLTYVA